MSIPLRVIGGQFRGRQIEYLGDPRTRPMKDDVREATFNLVGGWLSGKHAFDLFAGTGAIGIEALSRGAAGATFIERNIPASQAIRRNLTTLGIGIESWESGGGACRADSSGVSEADRSVRPTLDEGQPLPSARLLTGDTFYWLQEFFGNPSSWPTVPWAVFISPPYDMWVEEPTALVELVDRFRSEGPAGTLIVVESDRRFATDRLPDARLWRTRRYPPAVISVLR